MDVIPIPPITRRNWRRLELSFIMFKKLAKNIFDQVSMDIS